MLLITLLHKISMWSCQIEDVPTELEHCYICIQYIYVGTPQIELETSDWISICHLRYANFNELEIGDKLDNHFQSNFKNLTFRIIAKK